MQNVLLDEIMIQQRLAAIELARSRALLSDMAPEGSRTSPREAVAAALVRLGMLIDRAAGERAVASPALRGEGGPL